jgi:UDP:flavonoid glycosyltransferase YjiC (YdhE family)
MVAGRLREGYAHLDQVYVPGQTVLVGHPFSFFTRAFEEKHAVPAATLHLAPSIFRSAHRPPAHAPGRDLASAPRWVKRTFWWAIDRLLIDPQLAGPLNRWRREIGLAPVRRPFHEWIHSPQRVIGLFPDWFGVPQPDWPAAVRLTSFPLYDESEQSDVPPRVQAFLDAGPPPIVFTPGSANQTAERFLRAAMDAAHRLNRRALLLTRYSAHLPPLPSSVHHEPYVPLSRILPRCAAHRALKA